MMDFSKEARIAELAVRASGKVLMKYFEQKNIKIHSKGSYDFATEADLAAEKIMLEIIKKKFPSHNIISEETGNAKIKSDYNWFIDPLDGTHNFAFGMPIWGPMLALRHRGEIVISAASIPILKEVCTAQKNEGAYLNGKKMRVSDRSDIRKSAVYFSGDLHLKSPVGKRFIRNALGSLYRELRIIGCIAAGGIFVASGRLDAVVADHNKPWDILPIALLVEEAGGKVTGLNGKGYIYHSREYIFSNGLIHDKILGMLKD